MIFGFLGEFGVRKIFFRKNIFFDLGENVFLKIKNLEKIGKCWILKDFQWVSLVNGLEGEIKNLL